ncbi:MAG: hypothetical protein OEZ36_10250 [Spirochaetota bacterium]|nr:hypothetical protein [Spirochaetota bacterium]
MKIAHIINPVKVGESSDLYVAQPITFETMKQAKRHAGNGLDVELLTTQYPEDRSIIPEGFVVTEDLDRSISDIAQFKVKRKLPLIKDILDRLYENSDADYFIYTNVDIAVQPHFYQAVKYHIDNGLDAMVINRRTISKKHSRIDEIPLMCAEVGDTHRGFDCFVYKREVYPKYSLGTACIGKNWVGRVIIANVMAYAKSFQLFKESHLTFHIGNDWSWKSEDYVDYTAHNRNECHKALIAIEQDIGTLDRKEIPGSFYNQILKNQ